jgi:hypothetical protein
MAEETLDVASLQIEAQVERLQAIADPVARVTATELVASVLELHAAALARILEVLEESGHAASLPALDRDPLVRSILLLHDLHPRSTFDRVQQALNELEGRLKKREAIVELLNVEDGAVMVRLTNQGGSCGVEALVEDAIRDAAPEIASVAFASAPAAAGFVPITVLDPSALASTAGTQK